MIITTDMMNKLNEHLNNRNKVFTIFNSKEIKEFISIREMAKFYGVSSGNLNNHILGKYPMAQKLQDIGIIEILKYEDYIKKYPMSKFDE